MSSADFDRAIRLIDIAIAVGQFIPLITAVLAVASVAIAIYSFSQGNIAGGIVSSFFAVISLAFLAQLSRKRKQRRHSKKLHVSKPAYKEAASA